MERWINLINLLIGSTGLVLSILGLIIGIIFNHVDHVTRRYFIGIFSALIVYTASVFTYYMIDTSPEAISIERWSLFLESFSSSLLMPLLTFYLLHLCGERWRRNQLLYITVGLWLIYAALLIYAQFSESIYTFEPSTGYYRRGPFYPVLLVSPVAIMAINLWGVLRRRACLNRKQFFALVFYLLLPMACMLIQMRFYGILTVAAGTVISALVMFVFLLLDQQERYIRQIEDNVQKEFDIRILQMRPHFIYNALTSIYYITEEDTIRGLQVLNDFTNYLRRVFSSVNRREPIPFTEELEYTRAYLAVEQARFEDRLSVIYDTPHTSFRLPPLTLQPLVENAVKHGMDPELGHMNIFVRTRCVDGGSAIIVENDGVDLIPIPENEEGVGIGSTRERLKQMCGGSLKLEPRECGGTVATLWIPDVKQNGAEGEV